VAGASGQIKHTAVPACPFPTSKAIVSSAIPERLSLPEEVALKYFVSVFLLLLSGAAWSQQMSHRMTNKDVIDMVALGLSDDVIVAKIRSASRPEDLAFDTSTEGLKQLKAGNVSDAVMKVMINPAPAPPITVGAPGAAPAVTSDPNLPPQEVGVYWRNGYTFLRVESEILSQAKVGGRAGSTFTYGLRSQHWDAYVNGPTSKNRIKEVRPLFYFYVPDGASASDFILIKLEKKGNRREFQVGSFGGLTGGKSGVKRDKEIPFKSEHVAVRTYRIALEQDLKAGEYAFFMGTGQQAMMSSNRGRHLGRQRLRPNLRFHDSGLSRRSLTRDAGNAAIRRVPHHVLSAYSALPQRPLRSKAFC
jgi:hypothetical protein